MVLQDGRWSAYTDKGEPVPGIKKGSVWISQGKETLNVCSLEFYVNICGSKEEMYLRIKQREEKENERLNITNPFLPGSYQANEISPKQH
jgi:hypothetical protein